MILLGLKQFMPRNQSSIITGLTFQWTKLHFYGHTKTYNLNYIRNIMNYSSISSFCTTVMLTILSTAVRVVISRANETPSKTTKTPRFDDRDISLISVPVPFQTDTRYNITTVGFLNTSLGNVCRMCVRHFLQNRYFFFENV